MSTREFVSPEERRQSFLRLVCQIGKHDGLHAGQPLREEAYLKDEEALLRYRICLEVGKRERARLRHEI